MICRNCKFKTGDSGQFLVHMSSGMPQHHAGGLMCPDRQPDKLSSGPLKKASQVDKSGWALLVRSCVRRIPLRWPDRQPDKLSSGHRNTASLLNESDWLFIVRRCPVVCPVVCPDIWADTIPYIYCKRQI